LGLAVTPPILGYVPTGGLSDGVFRANLEEAGMGYKLEVQMIYEASVTGLLTCPDVFD